MNAETTLQSRVDVLVEYVESNRALAEVAEAYALLLALGKYVPECEFIERLIERGQA